MCTAITLQSVQEDNFFGRTMDFPYLIEPGLYVIPQNYEWHSYLKPKKYTNCYGFIGIGQEVDGMLSFFDGVNERGFAAAALYFADYACYDLPINSKEAIASLDFLHYILGRCNSVDDLKILLKNICIVGQEDPITKGAAPLHWVATDRTGKCAVIEQTKTGLEIIDNPIGIMTNSPDFHWHMTNLRNYMNISVMQKNEVHWGNISLTPLSTAMGTMQLPGRFTSPERFVRTAFLKTHVEVPKNESEAIMTCFHIMNSVSIPKGIVLIDISNIETCSYTIYTSFINTTTCEYYFKTYENDQIITASLWDYNMNSTKPLSLGSIVRLPISFESY